MQGTPGAEPVKGIDIPHAELVLRKGYRDKVDSYSAFNEADRRPIGLAAYLRDCGLKRVFLVGLGTDFCVAWSAVDAPRDGFDTYVVEDARRGIDINSSLPTAWDDMNKARVHRIQSTDLAIASG